MAANGLTQQEAQELFDVSGFLLLQDLPQNTQIAIDAHPEAYLTNDQFQGIKLLPPGWHCISWNVRELDAVGDKVCEAAFGGQGTVKNLLLRWFEQGEVAVRGLDRANEELVVPGSSSSTSRRSQRKLDPQGPQQTPTIVSRDLLKSLDARLLPYPRESHAKWQQATRNLSGQLGRAIVAKVVGMATESGDAILDSLTTGPADEASDMRGSAEDLSSTGNPGRSEQGKRIWGKSRSDDVSRFEQLSDDEDQNKNVTETQKRKRAPDDLVSEGDKDDGLLHFTPINLRRSWPPGSLGPEITRWSRDKSWLLRHTEQRSYIGVANIDKADVPLHCALLCELELAFILFVRSGNAHCWEQWKCIVSLFCRASSYLGAGSEWQPHPSASDTNEHDATGSFEAHAAFLLALRAQMELLEYDFWATQSTPSDEKYLVGELDALRVNIGRSLSWHAAAARSSKASQNPAVNDLIGAWRTFSHLTLAKFDWQLDRKLDEEAEVEQDLEAEEGDDAPIVVEM